MGAEFWNIGANGGAESLMGHRASKSPLLILVLVDSVDFDRVGLALKRFRAVGPVGCSEWRCHQVSRHSLGFLPGVLRRVAPLDRQLRSHLLVVV